VYRIFSPALCTSLLNLLLCMACSSFTMQIYVHTFNLQNYFPCSFHLSETQ
jgi:hypothetical protein